MIRRGSFKRICLLRLKSNDLQIAKSQASPANPRLSRLNTQHESNISMLRSCIGGGTLRSLCVRRLTRTALSSTKAQFSSAPTRYLQPPASADHVPLRKQLKEEAKALRSHKRQRKETEEASREEWELTVGVEIHAQLDTETKLFSREYACTSETSRRSSHKLNRGSNFHKRYSQFQRCVVRPGLPG